MTKESPNAGPDNSENIGNALMTLGYLLERDKAKREALIVQSAQVDFFDSANFEYPGTIMQLRIPLQLYVEHLKDKDAIQDRIRSEMAPLWGDFCNENLTGVWIRPMTEDLGPDWRAKLNDWLLKTDLNNQGFGHPLNPAALAHDGLRFRSKYEINLYEALKARRLAFAPLPVVLSGPKSRRIEPDFVIFKDGLVMVVEVDAQSTHREYTVDAQDRLRGLTLEGIYVTRVDGPAECKDVEAAKLCVDRLLKDIDKHKTNRR